MIEQTHIISKLLLELKMPSASGAFELQRDAIACCKEQLLPELSVWLSKCAPPDELLRINRLELDIGCCSRKQLMEELPRLIIAALNKQYASLLHAGLSITSVSHDIERKPLRKGYFEYWLFYLKNGYLPINMPAADKAIWENAVLETIATETSAADTCCSILQSNTIALQRLTQQFSPGFLQLWAGALYGPPAQEIFRLAEDWMRILTDKRFASLVNTTLGLHLPAVHTGAGYKQVLVTVTEALAQRAIQPGPVIEQLLKQSFQTQEQLIWEKALKLALPLHKGQLPSLRKAVEALSEKNGALTAPVSIDPPVVHVPGNVNSIKTDAYDQPKGNSDTQPHIIKNPADTDPIPGQWNGMPEQESFSNPPKELPMLRKAVNPVQPASPATNSVTEPALINDILTQDAETIHFSINERFRLFKEQLDKPAEQKETAEKNKQAGAADGTLIYITNAGLVLLHPFLHPFFNSLGLLEGKAFTAEGIQKAVHLLAFLAHGEMNIQDDELVLPKLLCGMPPAEPVDRFIVLSDAEKTAAIELLDAVLQHWKALGNASIDGLRANFLLREGRLIFRYDQWQLQVTQQAFDVLLEKLPWGFGSIKLPWTSWMLTTLWI